MMNVCERLVAVVSSVLVGFVGYAIGFADGKKTAMPLSEPPKED